MEPPVGEKKTGSLRVGFDSQLKLEFHGAKVTSDAGLLTHRELDNALGLTAMAEDRNVEIRSTPGTSGSVSPLPSGYQSCGRFDGKPSS